MSALRRTLAIRFVHMPLIWIFLPVIFQLFHIKDAPFHSRIQFTAYAEKKMGLPKEVIEHTITVPLELSLIKRAGKGLEPHHTTVWTTNGIPSSGIRQFHRQMIERALNAIETQSLEERTLHSHQVHVLKSDVPILTRDLLKFGNLILRKYGRAETRDAEIVYGLNLQLFKLSDTV